MIYINYEDDEFIAFININGEYHRLDGPAIIWDNSKYWFIDGKQYNETNHHKKLKEMMLV